MADPWAQIFPSYCCLWSSSARPQTPGWSLLVDCPHTLWSPGSLLLVCASCVRLACSWCLQPFPSRATMGWRRPAERPWWFHSRPQIKSQPEVRKMPFLNLRYVSRHARHEYLNSNIVMNILLNPNKIYIFRINGKFFLIVNQKIHFYM